MKDLTATLAAGGVEKRLLHHMNFNGIVCYISKDTWCLNYVTVQTGLTFVVNLALAKTNVSGKTIHRLPHVFDCPRQIINH